MHLCENCGVIHNGTYGSGRFCGTICSRSFSTKAKRQEINKKVSATIRMKRIPGKRICKSCNAEFQSISKTKFCSAECLYKVRSQASKKGRNTAKERGTFTGWKTGTVEPSYPEKYFISLFEKEGIDGYIRELPAGRWFIDFAFPERMLAIEIDGHQHEQAQRKIKDKEKDSFLLKNGWTVIRVKWKNPISESNKQFLYHQIDSIKQIFSVRC